jgi:hypothetical protein
MLLSKRSGGGGGGRAALRAWGLRGGRRLKEEDCGNPTSLHWRLYVDRFYFGQVSHNVSRPCLSPGQNFC